MTRYLLDTGTAMIALGDPGRLTPVLLDAVLAGSNVLSVISYWEVVLKSMKGTLNVGPPGDWWAEAIEKLAADPLPLRPVHVAGVSALPPVHKDPFDRILIAQAIAENLTFATTDAHIRRYACHQFRVLS